jgi:Family of unknown function (DUF6174)
MRPVRPLLIICGAAALVACDRFGGGDPKSSDRVTTASRRETISRACGNVDASRMPDPSAGDPRGGYTTLVERDSLLRLIESAEQRWLAARPASYTVTVVAACFCRDRGMPVVLRVAGDSVVASRDTTGQQSWPDDWRTSLHVAGLFKEARQATCDSTRTTRVTVDPQLGYPRVLRSESRLELTDTDREYRVLSFSAESGQ